MTPAAVVKMLEDFGGQWANREHADKRVALKIIGIILRAINLGLRMEFVETARPLTKTDVETLKRARKLLAEERQKLPRN